MGYAVGSQLAVHIDRRFLKRAGIPPKKTLQVPRLTTPAFYRKTAEELRARIAKAERQIASWKAQLLLAEQGLKVAAGEAEPARINGTPLSDERIDRTMSEAMNVDTTKATTVAAKRGAGRATRKHPAQKKLYEKGSNIAKLCKELNEGYPRVSKWFGEGEDARPIPRRHAEYLRDKYGIALSVWSKLGD